MKSKKLFSLCAVLFLALANVFSLDVMDINEVNAFDRPFMNPYSKSLDYAGTGFEIGSVLTPCFLINKTPVQDYWKIGVEYAQTMLLAYGAKEIAKLCVERYRPYMYFEGAPQDKIDDGDYKKSFFSGHTTLSFAAAGFTTYQALVYYPNDYWYKWVAIGTSYALCTTTAILRLASGNHFMTDVLCGALVGSAIGYFVPWVNHFWFKPTLPQNVDAVISPLGFNVKIDF